MLKCVVSENRCNRGRAKTHPDFKLSVVILNGFLGGRFAYEILGKRKISCAFQVILES